MSEKTSDVKIIAFVGMCGSGKSTAIEVLTKQNIPKVYFGGVILNAIKEAGLEITPENEKRFREELRQKEGKDFIVNRVVKVHNCSPLLLLNFSLSALLCLLTVMPQQDPSLRRPRDPHWGRTS